MPDFGDGSPRDDYGAVDPYAPSVANGQITPEQWEAYQQKRRRDAIIGILTTLGATTGLGALGGALSGGAAAGSAASSAGGAGGLAPIAGGAPWAATPYAVPAIASGTGAAAVGGTIGAGAGLTGGGVSGALAGMSARDIAALATGAAGTIGGALSKPTDLSPNTSTTDPQLKELLDMMSGRLKKSEPLHDSILQMANGLLPTQYQNGGRGNG